MTQTAPFPSCKEDCDYALGIERWNTELFQGYGKNSSSIGVDANLIYFPEQKTAVVIFSNYGCGNQEVIDMLVQESEK
jgi:D-alanyl-D-alanine carboxypeptidase